MSFLGTKILYMTPFITAQTALNRLVAPSASPIQIRNYAARKGTRERKKKAKVKVEVKKIGFIPHNQRDKDKFLLNRPQKKFDDSWKREPIDNVFPMKYYKWIVYPFEEAVKAHRETHHPEIYNKPDADLYVTVELNMQGEKKSRFVDNFKSIAAIPHKFEHGEERSVIVFAKDGDAQKEALEAGAQVAGGVELIKQIQGGQVSLFDFQHILAHPDIMPELVVLRGIMKRRFPNPRTGTLGIELGIAVERFLHGISFMAQKDEHEKDFGVIEAVIGTLNMNEKELEENFAVLIKEIYTHKPRREGHFISRCLLWSPPSREKLKIDHNIYLVKDDSKSKSIDEEIDAESVAL